jgi:DNA polymerase
MNSQSTNKPEDSDASAAVRKALGVLEREAALGLDAIPVEAPQIAAADSSNAPPARRDPIMQNAATERPVVSDLSELLVEPAVREAATLEALKDVIGDCSRCKLGESRTNIVFGVGNPEAELMFVGEGPGEEEDRRAEPFVGRAGKLLTDIITKGMGVPREDVYIANVVKCRPPANRNPQPDEIVACEPFLHRQIGLIRPKVIVTLGTFATQVLLKNRIPISKQRGQWFEYLGVPLMPTFHPAYLLRNGGDKRLVWDDIQQVMQRLGLPLPAK